MKQTIHSRASENEIIQLSVREDQDSGKHYIEWFPIVFNQRSRLINDWAGIYYEVIESQTFDRLLADPNLNTKATVDHERSKMLGRIKSGTLKLEKTEYGIRASVEVPETTVGKDIYEQVKRGDYQEGSFIYKADEKSIRWDRSQNPPTRYVSNALTLADVSIVQDAAFANTNVYARSSEWESTQPQPQPENLQPANNDILQKQIEIFKLKK